jgi:hypothetical protein
MGRALIGVGALMVMVGVGLDFFGVEGASLIGVGGTLLDVLDLVWDILLLLRPEK